MLKCLKPICYEINCSDNDIINSIMESSCFYGEFLNNSFKMQLLSQNSIFIQNGINPIFCLAGIHYPTQLDKSALLLELHLYF